MKLPLILFSFMIFAVSTVRVLAAEADSDKWYEVEVILFAHPSGGALQSERWTADPGIPKTDKNVDRLVRAAIPPPGPNQGPLTNAKSVNAPLQILSVNDLRLKTLADKLNSSAGYRVLMHTAWRQPVSKGERGSGVLVDNTVDAVNIIPSDPRSIETSPFLGVVSLTSTRYLHLALDLLFRDPELIQAASVLDSTTPQFSMGTESEIPLSAQSNTPIAGFRMTESRRIRLEQIQYFDHPLFGVIARVTAFDTKTAKLP